MGLDVIPYSINRLPMKGIVQLDCTTSKADSALMNLLGLCATLTLEGRRQFLNQLVLQQPDIVWLDTSLFGLLIKNIRLSVPKAKIISYFHNVEIDLLRQRISGGAFHYIPAYISTYLNEKHSAQKSDEIIAITNSDLKRINKYYSTQGMHVIPVSLCPGTVVSNNNPRSDEVVFVGSDFGPNIEGLKFLNDHVAPLLKNTRVLVVGSGLERHLKGNVHARLLLLGYVDDIGSIYSRCKVSLAPIFSGGGMKVKIAESLMNNCPVISTSFAAIGYEDASNDSIHRIDTAEEFAKAIENWRPLNQSAPINDFNKFYSVKSNASNLMKILSGFGSLS